MEGGGVLISVEYSKYHMKSDGFMRKLVDDGGTVSPDSQLLVLFRPCASSVEATVRKKKKESSHLQPQQSIMSTELFCCGDLIRDTGKICMQLKLN